MLESFSAQTIKIIEDAKKQASKFNSPLVGSEHLLLAMYLTNDSICKFLLNEKNISYDNLIDTLNNITVIHKASNKDTVFTDKFQEIILQAENLAKEIGSELVFDEHVFYAMLEDKNNVGTEILIILNIDIEEMLKDIEDIFNFYEEDVNNIYPYLINLSKQTSVHPHIERSNFIERINYIIDKKQKHNPLLIGSAGVGKTSIVEGLASIRTNDTIYQLDLGSSIAGTKYRGELEEKIIKTINFVKKEQAILFIDEIHNIVGAGSNDGSLDIANILKPYLSRSDICIIGATTLDEYYKFIEKDKALMRRFQPIFIDEPSNEETKTILMAIKHKYEEYHDYSVSEEDIDLIINKCSLYLPNRAFPDKAIDVLDELGSRKKKDKLANNMDLILKIINDIAGVKTIPFQELKNLKLNYNNLKPYYLRFIEQIKRTPNIFSASVDKNFNINPLINDLNKIFKFKKEMYLEIDLNFYKDHTTINNLLGSSKGYVGYEQGGILSEHLLKYPMALVYFKGYDKAHISIKNIINKIMKTNTMLDNMGRRINFQNTMFLYDIDTKTEKVGFINSDKKEINTIHLVTINNNETDECEEILNKYNIKLIDNKKKHNETLLYQMILNGEGTYEIINEHTYIKLA